MTALLQAARDLQLVCEERQWRYCFIGGLAVLRWGEPRETVDVDLTLLTGFVDEGRYIDTLTSLFEARRPDAAAFARTSRVLLLRASSGVGFDIALGGLPFEESAVSRSSLFRFPSDVELRTCSAEDLIVFKAFADRPKDWVDIEGVIVRQSGRLNWAAIETDLAPLVELKEAPEILGKLRQLRISLEV